MKPSEQTREGVLRRNKHCIQIPALGRPTRAKLPETRAPFYDLHLPAYSCLANTSEPFRTRVFSCLDEFGKTRGPLPPAQRGQAQGSGPSWARLCRGGVVAGRPRTPRDQARGGTSHQAHPGAPGPPRARAGAPPSQPLRDRRRALASRAGTQTPERRPRGGLGTHALSRAVGGLSPAGSRPRGLRECEPPMARSLAPRCARPCSAARRLDPDPGRGGGGGAGEEGWGGGAGDGGEPCLRVPAAGKAG